jgi:cation diffusion facilitator CzcD-associated flavoprotein CzcO
MAEGFSNSEGKLRHIIIGSGMAGVLAAIKLKERGEPFILFEKAEKLGGTWRDNRYPGLTCDVPAHAYTYSFEPYAEWNSFYATGTEIRTYFQKTAEKYGVLGDMRFDAEVTRCEWDDAAQVWRVGLANGEQYEADVVTAASGVLHHARMPDIEGLDSFEGDVVHSARWDDKTRTDGVRVGVIGNGSTGVQIVSALQKTASHLVHFQRSPQWIMPVPQFDYSEEEKQAFRDNPALIDEIRNNPDYWASIHRFTAAIMDVDGPELAEVQRVCEENLENSVADPELREKLRPDYKVGCKRLIYSWSYYDAVQQANVSVEREGISHIEPKGVRLKDGRLIELDTIILATGFHADRFIRPTVVTGAGGVSLDDFWQPRPTAYYAVAMPNFPNLFMLNGPSGPVGNFSLIDIAERQWDYVEQLLAPLREEKAKTIAPTTEAHLDFEERRSEAARKTIFGSGCSSWYLDALGVPATWPWSYQDFADAMANPDFAAYRYE